MSNLYNLFRNLLPQTPLQVGTVLAQSGGVVDIQLPGGGVIQARGSATIGQRAFVRDGVIEGTAPELQIEVISI